MRHTANIVRIVIILTKHFAFSLSGKRRGEKLCSALQELGPAFIKLGQALSVRSDIVGDEVADDLAKLQDRLPPFSAKEARATIERELGQDIFKEFDDEPVAAASISQVHFAVTQDNKKVAVKILRPNIEKRFNRDVELMYFVARNALMFNPKLARLKPVEIVDNFAQTVKQEMDLRIEAAAAAELKENMSNDDGIIIPEVDWQRTSRRVMTLERIDGIRVDDIEKLKKQKHDPKKIVQLCSEIFFKQVYRDGFFHADMHPGNLFVDKKGNLIAVDFGIMGRIDHQTKVFLAEMLLGFLNRDYQRVADIHFKAGYIPSGEDRELFAQACRSIGEPIFGKPQKDISLAKLLAVLFKVSEDFNMETQPQLLLLQKTMLLAEGLGRKLDPEVNFWELSRPLIEEWGRKNLGPEAKIKEATEDLKNLGERLRKIANVADILPEIITKDGIKIHPETLQAMQGNKNKRFYWWKTIIVSAIVATLVFLIMYKLVI